MKRLLLIVCIPFILPAFLAGQDPVPGKDAGFVGEFLKQLDDVEAKTVRLAEAIPQEHYAWRPAEGVRSISEVFLHTAGGNYFFLDMMGVKPPPDVNMSRGENSLEKSTTDRAEVVAILKRSFGHIREHIATLTSGGMERSVKLFGRETTLRNALFTMANHHHEHLGQSIAYARMRGIVPPWTAERMERQKN
jgi:uncharacterized damage-inducible protein DinB